PSSKVVILLSADADTVLFSRFTQILLDTTFNFSTSTSHGLTGFQKLGIHTVQRSQFLMATLLNQPARLEHKNAVGMTDGRQAVRNRNNGTSFRHFGQGG